MGEFFFVLKTLVITIALILILQIKVGKETIEQRSLDWMHESVAVNALRGVADGAVAVADNGFTWAAHMYKKNFGGGSSSAASSSRHSTDTRGARAQHKKSWENDSTPDEADLGQDVD